MKRYILCFVFGACLVCAVPAFAQIPDTLETESQKNIIAPEDALSYEKPTFANMSRLYWALGKLDIENNFHVDNYMLINECEIYKDYFFDDFQWNEIREAARDSIKKSKKDFPIRFTFTQEIKLGAYDVERQAFDVIEGNKIDVARRFSVNAVDFQEDVCGHSGPIPAYPKGLLLEFNRPFIFLDVPVGREKAARYINDKSGFLKGSESFVSRSEVYETRTAYLVLNVKILSYKDDKYISQQGSFTNVFAALESYEVYSDYSLTDLLYSKSFRRSRTPRQLATEAADVEEDIPPLVGE